MIFSKSLKAPVDILPKVIFKYVGSVFLLIALFKFALYYLLQKYRVSFGGNYRITVILGKNKQTTALENFFNNNPEFGYIHKKTFSLKDKSEADLESCFEYIKDELVDEIYCSVSESTNKQLNKIIDFADNNLKIVKFLPDNKDIYSKKLKYEYYNYTPILTLRNIPLEDSVNQFLKRLFDIVFSLAVIVFLLSWLTPLLAILITLCMTLSFGWIQGWIIVKSGISSFIVTLGGLFFLRGLTEVSYRAFNRAPDQTAGSTTVTDLPDIKNIINVPNAKLFSILLSPFTILSLP